MHKILPKSLLLLFIVAFSSLSAQKKSITLEEITGGAFRTEYLGSLKSLKNGKEYIVQNYDKTQRASTIDVYDYKKGTKVRTIVNSKNLAGIDYIISYKFSEDESKLLLATKLKQIYRHSSVGTYYVYDINTKKLNILTQDNVQEPTFNNDGTKVAYGFENNLYIKNLVSGDTKQITTDGKKNSIINGITDWVYEEEFAFVRAFDWNKTGNKIAYIRFDETNVPEYSMDIMGEDLYPTQQVFKYPKAGENNSEVSLWMYDVASNKTSKVDISGFENYYIPRIMWTEDASLLSVQLMNRHQNVLDLILVDASKNNATTLLHKETDDAYVDVKDNLTFLNNNSFIWTSEKSGWNHLYHYSKDGKTEKQLTKGDWEVTNYYGFDPKSAMIYFQSTENGSINRDVYTISIQGTNKTRLSKETGTNAADFSADFTYYINTFSSSTTPYVSSLNDSKTGNVVREIKNNSALINKLKDYKMSPKEYSTISINGNDLNMYTIKPLDFDETKQYSLFMYQYSGPGSQQVANRWNGGNDYWHQMLAQEGFIVICVDGRGTGLKGRDFKKVTQLELGKYEVEDQIAVAQKMGDLPYIDASRIGIWGWSYGGFMSSNCLFQANDIFSMAIAVAPVSSWRFYDTIYTERYMQTPQENASGYDENSPITYAGLLKGNFLLVHGGADDNVHLQNTLRLSEVLIQANKQFDWAIYPDKNHGIYGGNTRIHLYTKMTNFVRESLGKPTAKTESVRD